MGNSVIASEAKQSLYGILVWGILVWGILNRDPQLKPEDDSCLEFLEITSLPS